MGPSRRTVLAGLAAAALLPISAPARAQESADAAAWQAVVTSQIQAFRDGDAETAFVYAGKAAKALFSSARLYLRALSVSSYAIIAASRSHSFGSYLALGERGVMQRVTLVGAEQDLREAIYLMLEEKDGWRVQGVVLLGRGMAI